MRFQAATECTMPDLLTAGREASARHAWTDAYEHLSAADRESPLASEDLERLAMAAHLIGRSIESKELLARAHGAFLDEGRIEDAARCGFWLGFLLYSMGEQARGSGWLARTQRVLDDDGLDCVVRGFLLLPPALGALGGGDAEKARELFRRADEIGERYGDTDLQTMARLGQGQANVKQGKTSEGMRLLDETMVAVTAGEVSPIVVGIVYCAVISACHDVFDLSRAHEWTAAFGRWCASEPDLVPFRGECLTRRAEIMQWRGRWSDALDEARRAGELLAQEPGQPAAGAAFYRQAELHRLRGEYEEAEEAFREAGRWGRSPHPGMALLRLAQGRIDAAASAIRRALGEARSQRLRAVLLAAAVEIYLACEDAGAARAAAADLADLAAAVDAPFPNALSAFAEGCILLDEGRPDDALTSLNRALSLWQQLDAPYDAARTRVQIARACRALGDSDACEIEIDEARRTFERLNAAPDLARLDERASDAPASDARASDESASRNEAAPGGLTPREVEVLELVATGKTNRAIAEELFISEKTVARHVSNIFNKLEISSRAAATAYAYEHGIV